MKRPGARCAGPQVRDAPEGLISFRYWTSAPAARTSGVSSDWKPNPSSDCTAVGAQQLVRADVGLEDPVVAHGPGRVAGGPCERRIPVRGAAREEQLGRLQPPELGRELGRPHPARDDLTGRDVERRQGVRVVPVGTTATR
jgi:hypothetical protein